MHRTPMLLLLGLVLNACGSTEQTSPNQDGALAQNPSGYVQTTLHAGEPRDGALRADARRQVFPMYVGAAASAPVELAFTLRSNGQPMKLAVLSPVHADGARTTLGGAGYDAPAVDPHVSATLTEAGSYAIVVQHFDDARVFDPATGGDAFTLTASCAQTGSACAATDAIANFKAGALLTTTAIDVALNPALGSDEVGVSLSAEAPFGGERIEVATATATQGVAHLILPQPLPAGQSAPGQLVDGDDVYVSVEGLDDGTRLRLWLSGGPGVSVVRSSDFDNVFYVSGVGQAFEGSTRISLYSETRRAFLASSIIEAYLPGHAGSGLIEYSTPLSIGDAGAPNTPSNGDVLSITENSGGKGTDVRRYCFSFCDDPSGNTPFCHQSPVDCPAGEIGE